MEKVYKKWINNKHSVADTIICNPSNLQKTTNQQHQPNE